MLRLGRKLSLFRPTTRCRHLLLLSSLTSPLHKSHRTPSLLPPNKPFSSSSKPPLALLRGGCYDESYHVPPSLPICCGCGIHMQSFDPNMPGFFFLPVPKSRDYHAHISLSEALVTHSLKIGTLQQYVDRPEDEFDEEGKPVVCARCHSLRHYGRVKNAGAENLLPDFDFDHMVGPKILSSSGSRSVVLVVVDAVDFDGSFPRKVVRMLSDSIEENLTAWKKGMPGNVPRMVLVVTKIDLLPPSTSPTGLEYWARQRARESGAVKLTAVHMVSAVRDWGVRNLVEHVEYLAGPRGSVWAVGAQNAGKSTLINAMGRCVGRKANNLTVASVPGTTLGILRVEGVLGESRKLFDTPGILHSYQLLTRLSRDEQKLVHIGKALRPRTYRIKAGQSIHIAGLMRLDVEETSVRTIYVTVWASPLLPLHMGKMENACTFVEDHFGQRLQPPIGENRVNELGTWVRKEYNVSGRNWNVSSVDIAAAGLGWFAIGLNGEARLGVWTYDGIDVVLRSSLIPERAEIFEVAGFTVSKILSEADRKISKQKKGKKKKILDHDENLSALATTLSMDAQTLNESESKVEEATA